MSSRAILLWNLVFFAGAVLFLIAIYQVYLVATTPAFVVSGEHAGSYLEITFSPGEVVVDVIRRGILYFIAAGLLLFSVWLKRVRWVYWSLQVATLCVGLTLWYQGSYHLDPFPVDSWATLGVTALCSLVLLALYRPMTQLLGRFIKPS